MKRKVLYSPAFGAGWSTWNREYAEDLLFDADLIQAVEEGRDLGDEDQEGTPLHAFVQRLIAKHGPDAEHVYLSTHGLRVAEVEGRFRVSEYGGAEGIHHESDEVWF